MAPIRYRYDRSESTSPVLSTRSSPLFEPINSVSTLYFLTSVGDNGLMVFFDGLILSL